nr:unnamed protein product [uncultured Mediterranean phage uvMED]
MIDIIAPLAAASLAIVGDRALNRQNREQNNAQRSRDELRDTMIQLGKLTTAVQQITSALQELHLDMKADRSAIYELLNEQGNRITALEAGKD